MPCSELIAVLAEGATNNPVVLGNERLSLELPVADHLEGRRLDASGAQHVAEGLAGHPLERQREEPREHGAPDEVDVLPRLAGLRQLLGERPLLGECALDLLFGDGREAHARDRHGLVGRAYDVARVGTDELALTVEVGGDYDLVRLLRQVLDRLDDALLFGHLLDCHTRQDRQGLQAPPLEVEAFLGRDKIACSVREHARIGCGQLLHRRAIERRCEVDLHDVAFEADRDPILAVATEVVGGCGVHLVGLRLTHRKDLRDALGRYVLLRDDQIHSSSSRQGAVTSAEYIRRVKPEVNHILTESESKGATGAAGSPTRRRRRA